MAKKLTLKKTVEGGGDSPLRRKLKSTSILKPEPERRSIELISTGSWMLNLALSNNVDLGYPIGRVVNSVGDFSTGKTLMACELVNSVHYIEHLQRGKKVKIYYDEPEAAFDYDLAREFNMPLEHIHGLREELPSFDPKKLEKGDKLFKRSRTVEDFYTNIDQITKNDTGYDVVLYVLDSLDSLTDAREIKHIEKKGVGKQDYGGGKARVLSQMFRTCIQAVKKSNVLLFIVSQVRENFGVMFGPKYTRAGGKALDHYASIIYWLRESGKITHPTSKINQGIEVELLIDKNKTGSRYNNLNFNILHGYGVDNFGSAINFLWDQNAIEKSGNYIVWDDLKLYRSDLIERCANNEIYGRKLKRMLQEHWDSIIKEAKIVRKPKWGV